MFVYEPKDLVKFTRVPMKIEYCVGLAELINCCEKYGVEIEKITAYYFGFMVQFKGMSGDAVLHDSSYGRASGLWETMGMPWDDEDTSVHTAEELVKLIKEGKN